MILKEKKILKQEFPRELQEASHLFSRSLILLAFLPPHQAVVFLLPTCLRCTLQR